QNTRELFLSKSVACEGDPVTIICGTRHFENSTATLLCPRVISLNKFDEKSGQFIFLMEYRNEKTFEKFV
ncbi:hypothetical protein BgiBS90_004060, partial [Biomphalaria glabrata]